MTEAAGPRRVRPGDDLGAVFGEPGAPNAAAPSAQAAQPGGPPYGVPPLPHQSSHSVGERSADGWGHAAHLSASAERVDATAPASTAPTEPAQAPTSAQAWPAPAPHGIAAAPAAPAPPASGGMPPPASTPSAPAGHPLVGAPRTRLTDATPSLPDAPPSVLAGRRLTAWTLVLGIAAVIMACLPIMMLNIAAALALAIVTVIVAVIALVRERGTVWSTLLIVVGALLGIGAVVVSWLMAMSMANHLGSISSGALEAAHAAGSMAANGARELGAWTGPSA